MLVTDVTVKLTKRRPAVLTKESGDLVSNALGACEDQNLVVLVAHDSLEVLGHAVTLLEFGADLNDLLNAVVSRQIHGTDVDLDEAGRAPAGHNGSPSLSVLTFTVVDC